MPGYAAMTTTVTAQIHVYDVASARLLWSGTMTSEDERSLRVILDDLVKAGSAELKRQRLL
jgi:hypothetical protein